MSTQSPVAQRQPAFQTAPRLNRSLTASTEKRVLEWMAARAPRWVTSDQMTALGLAAQIAAGLGYAWACHQRYALVFVSLCLVLNWFGDSMDGTLARMRRQQRPRYGFYVDHMVDIFGSVALMCGLAVRAFYIGRRRLPCSSRSCYWRAKAISRPTRSRASKRRRVFLVRQS